MFATLTAPGFGPVHTTRTGQRGRCCPADPAATPTNAAARTAATSPAPATSPRTTRGSARPMCPDCYDYTGHVLFNALAPELWRRFTIYLPRQLARLAGITQRSCAARSGSGSSRSPNTSTAASSTTTPSSGWTPRVTATSRRPPGYTALLNQAIRQAAPPSPATSPLTDTATVAGERPIACGAVPVIDRISATQFGTQSDTRPSARLSRLARHRKGALAAGGRELHRQIRHQDHRRSGASRPAGPLPHRHRRPGLRPALQAAHLHRLGTGQATRPPPSWPQQVDPHARLPGPLPDQIPPLLGHLHRAAPGPHSTTAGSSAIRAATKTPGAATSDDRTVLLVSHLEYAGTGHATTAERALALAAAARAREHESVGREETWMN